MRVEACNAAGKRLEITTGVDRPKGIGMASPVCITLSELDTVGISLGLDVEDVEVTARPLLIIAGVR